jgi:glycerol-3-phosphate dehydrogenase
MPRLEYVYVGTSDDEYHGPLDAPRATRDEVTELLAMVQDCFPEAGLTLDDVLGTWAGIRPLIAEEGKSTRDTSREDEVWSGPEGLVTIAGGKLTTYRRMAERALDEVKALLGAPPDPEDHSDEVPLPGVPDEPLDAFYEARRGRLATAGLDEATIDRLLWLYGAQLDRLLAYGEEDPAWLAPLAEGVPALRGEVRHAVEEEMAGTLIDVMDRRTALLLFSHDAGLAGCEEAASILADLLGWEAARVAAEVAAYRRHAAEHMVPGDE